MRAEPEEVDDEVYVGTLIDSACLLSLKQALILRALERLAASPSSSRSWLPSVSGGGAQPSHLLLQPTYVRLSFGYAWVFQRISVLKYALLPQSVFSRRLGGRSGHPAFPAQLRPLAPTTDPSDLCRLASPPPYDLSLHDDLVPQPIQLFGALRPLICDFLTSDIATCRELRIIAGEDCLAADLPRGPDECITLRDRGRQICFWFSTSYSPYSNGCRTSADESCPFSQFLHLLSTPPAS